MPADPTRRRKILFQHIPKTAGTSLIEHAYANLRSEVCTARYDAELTDAMIDDDRLTFFHGHYSYPTVLRFRARQPDSFVFTLLRHPFARVLSQYHNWVDRDRVGRELAQIEAVQGHTDELARLRDRFETVIFPMSLDEFLTSEDPDVAHVAGNLQAQYLTDHETHAHRRYQHAVPNALMVYDFIGLQEFYRPCLRIVETKCFLPVGSLGGESHANTSEAAKSDGVYRIDAMQGAAIERRNAYDLVLFYTVFAELYRNYGALLPPLDADIEGLTGVRIA